MNYDRVILEMMDRIKTLEEKVAQLEAGASQAAATQEIEAAPAAQKSVSAKYRRLTEYLMQVKGTRVTLTYFELENILGFKLPDSAKKHMRAFWSNSDTHSYSSSWLAVGFKARVDMANNAVIFEKDLVI